MCIYLHTIYIYIYIEVGSVAKNCTRVKVLLLPNNINQVEVKKVAIQKFT